MTTPTKRSAKAKKLWAYPYEDGDVVTDVPPSKHDVKRGFCRPVFLLPAAPEDVERMREAVAKAMYDAEHKLLSSVKQYRFEQRIPAIQDAYRRQASAALTTLGLTPAKKTKAL